MSEEIEKVELRQLNIDDYLWIGLTQGYKNFR